MSINIPNGIAGSEAYSSKKQHLKPNDQYLSQYLHRDNTCNIYMINSAQMIKSQCSANENEVALLLEAINKFEADIREKQRLYSKTVHELASKIQERAENNNNLKAQIYQLKDEARKIKKESQFLRLGSNDKFQKCYSARDLFQGSAKGQSNLEHHKSSTNLYRMTLPSRNQVF